MSPPSVRDFAVQRVPRRTGPAGRWRQAAAVPSAATGSGRTGSGRMGSGRGDSGRGDSGRMDSGRGDSGRGPPSPSIPILQGMCQFPISIEAYVDNYLKLKGNFEKSFKKSG